MAERVRGLHELRSTGLLWLINASVLHPRGYAMALHYDDDMHCIGWSLLGDGSEPWSFDPGAADICFGAVRALLEAPDGE